MNRLIMGFALGFFILPLALIVFVNVGGMPVATKGKLLPFARYPARRATCSARS
jgi:hypothetical protein